MKSLTAREALCCWTQAFCTWNMLSATSCAVLHCPQWPIQQTQQPVQQKEKQDIAQEHPLLLFNMHGQQQDGTCDASTEQIVL